MTDSAKGPGPDVPDLRIVRTVGPWVTLAVIVIYAAIAWSGFQTSLRAVQASGSQGSAVATSSVESTVSAVGTGTIAVTRLGSVQLRAAADARSAALATVKKGTRLQVLNRTDSWLRVKDPAGHIGWIPNSTQSVEIRKK